MSEEEELIFGELGKQEATSRFIRVARNFMYTGALRLAVMRCLWTGEIHGQAIVHRIERITGGEWIPSPGSLYPLLQEMVDHGTIERRDCGRLAVYSLTPFGRTLYEAVAEDIRDHLDFIRWMVMDPFKDVGDAGDTEDSEDSCDTEDIRGLIGTEEMNT